MKYPTPWEITSAHSPLFEGNNLIEISWTRKTGEGSYEVTRTKAVANFPDQVEYVHPNSFIRFVIKILSVFLK